MKKNGNTGFNLAGNHVLLIVTAVCFILIGVSFFTESSFAPLRFFASITVVPMEKGLNTVGTWILDKADNYETLQQVQTENQQLQQQVDELTAENNSLQEDKYELQRLQDLYKLDQSYQNYNKVGAHVISKDSGNWFSQFVIDKGSDDVLLLI